MDCGHFFLLLYFQNKIYNLKSVGKVWVCGLSCATRALSSPQTNVRKSLLCLLQQEEVTGLHMSGNEK